MKKFLIMPDSFKGTMSSLEVATIIQNCIKNHHPDWETQVIPISDGGEGMVDCFLRAIPGEKIPALVTGP